MKIHYFHWVLKGFCNALIKCKSVFGVVWKIKKCIFETIGSGFTVSDSVFGPIGGTKINVTLPPNVVLRCIWLLETLLPGGSCWGLVTAEEIGGGFLNTFSFLGNVFLGRH